jgi:hypothetical protein
VGGRNRKTRADRCLWGHVSCRLAPTQKGAACGYAHALRSWADSLRHGGWGNVNSLAPGGTGLASLVGLFHSLIGDASRYARDNPNDTRFWVADKFPSQMVGLNARDAPRDDLALAGFVINGSWSLANHESLLRDRTKGVCQPARCLAVTGTVSSGPDQRHPRSTGGLWVPTAPGNGRATAWGELVGTLWQPSQSLASGFCGPPGSVLRSRRGMIRSPWSYPVWREFFWDRNGR